jgi:penicillin-binding protein 1A
VEPHTIDKVLDRDGAVLQEFHPPAEWPQVMDRSVAGIMNWMLVEVATAGTAAKAASLGLHVGGKTGTTNDNKDVWFVGFTPDILTTVWVGYDQPRTISTDATGGHIALPIWMAYMKGAAPKDQDRPFPPAPGVSWLGVDEASGRPMEGGRSMPFLGGTGPRGAATVAGQKTSEDLLTTEF